MSVEWVTIGPHRLACGDCRDVMSSLAPASIDCVVTDPPYGIEYESGMTGHDGGTALPGIEGDSDTSLRDALIEWMGNTPAIIFGSWKRPRPAKCKAVLIWEKGDHVGMGDLSMPWKPNTEEIYIIGKGFSGHRGSSVLKFNAPTSWNSVGFGRKHPHEKPRRLMMELVGKCPGETVFDPFMGSGRTGEACAKLGKRFIGVELCRDHFETSCRRIEDALHAEPLLAGCA